MLESQTVLDSISEHCIQSMNNALSAERHPLWQRICPELSDNDFIRLGIIRCISTVDSGRHFLQTADDIYDEHIPQSTYFNALKSSRRANMLKAVERQSYQQHCESLQVQGIDYLSPFPDLDEIIVEAADGHFVEHACHTEKGSNGKVYAAGFIYALNLRNGLMSPVCVVTNGTQRNQEIPLLRHQLEQNNKKKPKGQKHLYVYDKAVTDFAWWDQQKKQNNYMISVRKKNSVAIVVKSLPFDQEADVNLGVEAYETYENDKGIQFSVVTYRDPETQQIHQFISTLPVSTQPGTIAILYYKRWTIEKAYNNCKSNFKETKAWSPDIHSLNNQMRLIAMSYNLMRVFEELSKCHDPKLIHPSDAKYNKTLDKRQQIAKKQGCFVNPLFYRSRIVRISSYTIRAVQNAIIVGKSLLSFMNKLVARLMPKVGMVEEH